MTRFPPLWSLALGLPLLLRPALAGLDSQWSALFFQLRGARPPSPDPVLLAVDADSLSLDQLLTPAERRASLLWRRMGPWPWPRELQAELAALVLERGARQVVFNVVFAGPSRFGSADDAAFERRLAPWRRQVVLGAAYGASEQGAGAGPATETGVHQLSEAGPHSPAAEPAGACRGHPGTGLDR